MTKIFHNILLIIFLLLIALFAYKTLRSPKPTRVQVQTQKEAPSLNNKDDESTKNTLNEENVNNISDADLDKKIRDYIINHPEILIESIEGLQKKSFQESNKKVMDYLAKHTDLIETQDNPPMLGNKDGDISVVMFYDYNCSYCKKAHKFNQDLLEKDSNVKIILRPLPILGDSSMYLSKISLAVHKAYEEKFPMIHDILMTSENITEQQMKITLNDYDVDYEIIENELNSFSIKQLINKNFEFAKQLGIKGAPSYVVNGIFIPGIITSEKFATIIKEIRNLEKQTEVE